MTLWLNHGKSSIWNILSADIAGFGEMWSVQRKAEPAFHSQVERAGSASMCVQRFSLHAHRRSLRPSQRTTATWRLDWTGGRPLLPSPTDRPSAWQAERPSSVCRVPTLQSRCRFTTLRARTWRLPDGKEDVQLESGNDYYKFRGG